MTFDHALNGKTATVHPSALHRTGDHAVIVGCRFLDGNGRPEFLLQFTDGELDFFDFRHVLVIAPRSP